ncbi:MAG: ribose-phosphate pyrophosphokinase [Candidatus Omnitrophica bacterium]|nr:ribose-phosphate pyrophosphokinase [Candidatus Omnitrophota bacterium]MBU4487967.1 ribose-phosphate pyrophosphokinase [Candidatus Omnitrophota bacterium]MCG2705168.1 ribose-phosphate pyrophosphokinase [Candidatus Omnitrophota bacterium]
MKRDQMLVFTGNSNRALTNEICKKLEMPLGNARVGIFSEGEIKVKINEDVRGKDVFIIQSICPPVNDNLMELLILIDAVKRASAYRITAVIPYFGYARQDRKDQPRVPITAKLVANLLTAAGSNRVLTIDLHAGQIQGFFDIPLDHLFAINVFTDYFTKNKLKNLVVVSPDVGGVKMARAYAKKLKADLAVVDKRRVNDEKTEVMFIMGDVKDKNALIVDDIAATAGSLVEAVEALKKNGAKDIYAAVTHPILSGPAIERLSKSQLKRLLVTNTIPITKEKSLSKIEALSIAPLLAEAINRIHREESISTLFNKIDRLG